MIRDALFPPLCAVCGVNACRPALPVCPSCAGALQALLTAPCPECGRPASACRCPENERFHCLFWYGDALSRRLIHVLKNDADRRQTAFLGALLANAIPPAAARSCEAVTYVPRRARGLRQAGYDQAALLAEAAAREMGLPCIPTLLRRGETQQKLLSASERRRDIRNRYAPLPAALTEGGALPWRGLLLVDDVCTTGATLEGCAAVLRAAGVGRVTCAALARTPRAFP